jgi:hypothetical protein
MYTFQCLQHEFTFLLGVHRTTTLQTIHCIIGTNTHVQIAQLSSLLKKSNVTAMEQIEASGDHYFPV